MGIWKSLKKKNLSFHTPAHASTTANTSGSASSKVDNCHENGQDWATNSHGGQVAESSKFAKGGYIPKPPDSDHPPIHLEPGYVISKNGAQKFAKEALAKMNENPNLPESDLAKIIADKKDEIGDIFVTKPTNFEAPPAEEILANLSKVAKAVKQTKPQLKMIEEFQNFNLLAPQVADLIFELQSYCFHHKVPWLAAFDHLFKGVITNPFTDPLSVPKQPSPKKDHWSNIVVVAEKIAGYDGLCIGFTEDNCPVCSQPSKQSVDDSWAEEWSPGAVKGSGQKSHWGSVGKSGFAATYGAGKTFTIPADAKITFMDLETTGSNPGVPVKNESGEVVGVVKNTSTTKDGIEVEVIQSGTIKGVSLSVGDVNLSSAGMTFGGNPVLPADPQMVELGIAGEGKVTVQVKEFLDYISNHSMKKHWKAGEELAAANLCAKLSDVEVSEAKNGIDALFKIKAFTKGVRKIADDLLDEQMIYLKHNPPKKSPLTVPLFKTMKKLPDGNWNEGHWKAADLAAEKTLEGEFNETFYGQVVSWLAQGYEAHEWTADQYNQGLLALTKVADSKKNSLAQNLHASFPSGLTPPGQSMHGAITKWKKFCVNVGGSFNQTNMKHAQYLASEVFKFCEDGESVTSIAQAMVKWVNDQNPQFPKATLWSNGAKSSIAKAKDKWWNEYTAAGEAASIADNALDALKAKLTGQPVTSPSGKQENLTIPKAPDFSSAKNFSFLKLFQSLKSDGAMQYNELNEVGAQIAVYFDYLDQHVSSEKPKKAFQMWVNWLSKTGTHTGTKWQIDNMWQVLCYHSGAPESWVNQYIGFDAPDKVMPKKKLKPVPVEETKLKPSHQSLFFNDEVKIQPAPLMKATAIFKFKDAKVEKIVQNLTMNHSQDYWGNPEVGVEIDLGISVGEFLSPFGGSVEFSSPMAAHPYNPMPAPIPAPNPDPVVIAPVEKPVKAVKPKAKADTEIIHIKKGEQVIFLAEDEQYVTVPKGTKYTHIKR